MEKTVTLTTFRIYNCPIVPLTQEYTIPMSVAYIQDAMKVWDLFIVETLDRSAAVIFTHPETHDVQSVIY